MPFTYAVPPVTKLVVTLPNRILNQKLILDPSGGMIELA